LKAGIKNILQSLRIYHPLQTAFRKFIFAFKRAQYRMLFSGYKGSGFECNVCGSFYSKFADDFPSKENRNAIIINKVIAGYGENILCPHCLSNSRERLVIAMLRARIDISKKRILHLSPEKNIFDILKDKATVTTADLHPGFYKSIDKNIKEENATALSFENESLDLVIANHIMEHIPDDEKAMKEIYRVLKPGGNLIMQVPYSETISNTIEELSINNPEKQSALFGQKDHFRIYSIQNYIKRLQVVGFIVELIPYNSFKEYYKYAIQKEESFLMIKKPN